MRSASKVRVGLTAVIVLVLCCATVIGVKELYKALSDHARRHIGFESTVASDGGIVSNYASALSYYAKANEGRTCTCEWEKELAEVCSQPITPKSHFSPNARIWAMNEALVDVLYEDIEQPESVVLFFECKADGPRCGGRDDVFVNNRPDALCDFTWVGFADGTMKRLETADEVRALRWELHVDESSE